MLPRSSSIAGTSSAASSGTVFWLATALLTVALFFSHTAQVGGWSYWDVVILLGVFNALTGVVETVLRLGLASSPRTCGAAIWTWCWCVPSMRSCIRLSGVSTYGASRHRVGLRAGQLRIVRSGRPVAASTIVAFALTLVGASPLSTRSGWRS